MHLDSMLIDLLHEGDFFGRLFSKLMVFIYLHLNIGSQNPFNRQYKVSSAA